MHPVPIRVKLLLLLLLPLQLFKTTFCQSSESKLKKFDMPRTTADEVGELPQGEMDI